LPLPPVEKLLDPPPERELEDRLLEERERESRESSESLSSSESSRREFMRFELEREFEDRDDDIELERELRELEERDEPKLPLPPPSSIWAGARSATRISAARTAAICSVRRETLRRIVSILR
jgi:hypothetical protein